MLRRGRVLWAVLLCFALSLGLVAPACQHPQRTQELAEPGVGARVPTRPGPPGFRVQVVDAGSGRPLPGAEVRFGTEISLGWDGLPDRLRHERRVRRVGDVLQSGGALLRTDAEGCVRVPWNGDQDCWVSAAHGDQLGFGQLHSIYQGAPLVIGVRQGRDGEVLVKDAAGRAVAGVEVECWVDLWYGPHPVLRAVTDERGVAHFRGVDLLRDWPGSMLQDFLDRPRAIMVGPVTFVVNTLDDGRELGQLRTEREFGLWDERPLRCELRVGETAPFRVRVKGSAGAPLPQRAQVVLRNQADPSGTKSFVPPRALVRPVDAQGVALFPRVGLHQNLRVEVYAPGWSLPVALDCAGPRQAGVGAGVSLEWPPKDRLLRVRARDSGGRPLAAIGFRVEVDYRDGPPHEHVLRASTDASGSMWLRLPRQEVHGLRFRALDVARPWHCSWEPAEEGVSGLSADLDLRFQIPALVAEGVVVDPQGRGLAGVYVRGYGESEDGRICTSPTISGDDGTFRVHAIRGREDLSFVGIEARLPGRPGKRLHGLAIPAKGLRIVLAAGRLDWRLPIRLPEGLAPESVQVEIDQLGDNNDYDRGERLRRRLRRGERSLLLRDVQPEEYGVRLVVHDGNGGLRCPFLERDDLVGQREGEVLGEPLDLRGLVRVRCRVRMPDGKPVPAVDFSAGDGMALGGYLLRQELQSKDGEYQFWAMQGQRVQVWSPHGVRTSFLPRAAPIELQLERPFKVSVQVGKQRKLPAGMSWALGLRSGNRELGDPVLPDADGVVSLTSDEGERLELFVYVVDAGRHHAARAFELDLRQRPRPGLFRAPLLKWEEVATAVRALQRRR